MDLINWFLIIFSSWFFLEIVLDVKIKVFILFLNFILLRVMCLVKKDEIYIWRTISNNCCLLSKLIIY